MPAKDKLIVKKTLDLTKPPELKKGQKARLQALVRMPDESIDYGDAPSLPDATWMHAAQSLPESKKQITLRIDADVLEFFKLTGARYQSRMNAVLRAYVDAHKVQSK